MRLRIALGLVTLAGAAHAAEPKPAKLAEARALVAEAAMLGQAEAGGRVPRAYADGLREDLRDGLEKLAQEPGLAAPAKAALAAINRRDATALARLRDQLVAQERSHGRAD